MKIAVVGSNTIGAYIARKLSESGNSVDLFERKPHIGKEACSGLFSERIWKYFPEKVSIVKNTITSATVHFPKKTMKLDLSPKMLVFHRGDFDSYATDLAVKAGAKLHLGAFAKLKSHDKNLVTLETDKKEMEFDYLIACDGSVSTIRRELKLPDPHFRLGIFFYKPEESNSSFFDVWPTKKGFIWKLPRGKTTEYGIIEEPDTARKLFDVFCDKNSIKQEKLISAIIPMGLVKPFYGRIALCGDSIGLTKPWSGGGVLWGLIAADILVKTFPDFNMYQKQLKSLFSMRIARSNLLLKAFPLVPYLQYFAPAQIHFDADWGPKPF
ncbi:MAG: hypothetical protein HY362_01330 [Candidatus Aenigmarchaeota archaeon]|nr:hypothetical protein [Candidatus Aenigmarchaeota archaeon]